MRGFVVGFVVCACGLVWGCGPTFNWRESPVGETRLVALFPCKPEMRQRPVMLAQQSVELSMRSCDTAGVTFAVGHARVDAPQSTGPVLAHWRETTLANLRVEPATISALAPQRLQALAQLVAARGNGKSGGGEPVAVQAVWFVQDADVFMAIVYAGSISPEVAEAFFTGLRFR